MGHQKRFTRVIGFDESLNGFKVGDHHHPFVVMVGYMGNEGRGYGCPPFGSRKNRNFLGKKPSKLEEVLRCARPFLSSHPDYYYVVIPEARVGNPQNIHSLKAESIALITSKFFETTPYLKPQETAIYIDETDGPANSEYLNTVLTYLLQKEGLGDLHHVSFTRGEEKKQVIKIADMIAYYLASTKIISQSKKWPNRTKRLHLLLT